MLKNKKFSLFKKKSKEEKAIEQIRKKKQQIEKLKEEIIKMGRLVLKDGKLTQEAAPQQSQPQQEVKIPLPPIDIEYTRPKQVVEEVQEEEYVEPPMFRGQPQRRQEERAEPAIFRGRPQQQQQYQQPPQQQYQQPPKDITVDIIMIEGQTVQVVVPVVAAQNLLDAISTSIETGTMLVVGNKAINPRHIVMYQYA
jgi:hypothetical protein